MPLSFPEGSPQADQLAIYLPDSGQTLGGTYTRVRVILPHTLALYPIEA
jgi:hypothetical protein